MSVVLVLFLFPCAAAFAADPTIEIISEPPAVNLTIVTNAWTNRFDEKIAEIQHLGGSAEGLEDIRRKNPSETINCVTPCSITIPYKVLKRSEVKATKLGFPEYFGTMTEFYANHSKTPPKQINLKLTPPETAPDSCIFNKNYLFEGTQKEQPCYRPFAEAPKSLRRKKLSYKCLIEFDLDTSGRTQNILVTNCPKTLRDLSLKSVQSWLYVPRTQDGKSIAAKEIKTSLMYQYYDKKYGRNYPLSK